MIYTASGYPLITESNYHEVVQAGIEGGMGTGYRPDDAGPFLSVASEAKFTRIAERDYPSHIVRQDRDKSSPWHWFEHAKVPILNQKSYGFCWMYGTVGAIMCRYAMAGGRVPHLNAFGPAYQGKNGRNQGGWAGEALGYIERFGIPTFSTWPDQSTNRSLWTNAEQKADAAKHKVVEFSELPRNDLNALCSVLLDPINPRPVTMGLNWWGHLIYAVRVVREGVLIVNSWGESWGNKGLSVLSFTKAVAFEQIAVERVRPVADLRNYPNWSLAT